MAETPRSPGCESRFVHIIGRAKECELIAAAETVDIECSAVSSVGSVAGFGISEPSVVAVFFHSEVDNSLVLAVIDPRHTCQVALSVHNLELLYHIDRKIARCHRGVVGKEVLSVHQNAGYLFSICGNLSVGSHLHAGEAFQKVLHNSVRRRAVRFGGILHSILHYLYRCAHSFHHSFGKRHRLGVETERSQPDVAIGDCQVSVLRLITYV